jgi:hypothetical protein
MNNYIYINLSTGKISRSSGGGSPIFTIGEENPLQVYFLDYNKPPTYNSSTPPLGDPYTYTLEPINKASSNLVLRVGLKINNVISSQSNWSNLPTNISAGFSASTNYTILTNSAAFVAGDAINILSGSVSCSQQPISGSLVCNLSTQIVQSWTYEGTQIVGEATTVSSSYTLPYYFSIYEVSQMADSFASLIGLRTERGEGQNFDPYFQKSVYATSDSSYNFVYRGTARLVVIPGTTNAFGTHTFIATPGKFSNLDFTNPAWQSLLGSGDEVEIWIDAVLDNKVVAQGAAILRKKLSV